MAKSQQLLIERCKKGDEKAMLNLYDKYCDAMFSIACRYLNEEDAKDAMQESFIKAFSKLKTYHEDFTFGSWLKRIVIHQCIDELRKKHIEFTNLELETLDVEDDENWEIDVKITKNQVLEAISKLPHKYQVVVKLYLIEGYDHEEISGIINIPIKTSRTHLRRGRLQLQELLKMHYDETRY